MSSKKSELTFSVAWSEEDQVFVARVVEYPSLSAHGNTTQEALSEIKKVVSFVQEETSKS